MDQFIDQLRTRLEEIQQQTEQEYREFIVAEKRNHHARSESRRVAQEEELRVTHEATLLEAELRREELRSAHNRAVSAEERRTAELEELHAQKVNAERHWIEFQEWASEYGQTLLPFMAGIASVVSIRYLVGRY